MTEEHIPVLGKTVVGFCKTQDDKGYDVLHISFSDGSGVLVREEGQAGYFSVRVLAAGGFSKPRPDAQTRQHLGQDHAREIDYPAGEIPRTTDSGVT